MLTIARPSFDALDDADRVAVLGEERVAEVDVQPVNVEFGGLVSGGVS
jgi:hypothetical protein